jgi:hypothetical protein
MPNADEFELVTLISHLPFTHILDVITDLLAAEAPVEYTADINRIPAAANTIQIKRNFRFMTIFK